MPESSSRSPKPEQDPLAAPPLELPNAPDFLSRPPILPFDTIVALAEEQLPYELSRPDFEARRLRTKCRVEFVL